MNHLLIAAALASTGLVGAAQAQTPAPPPPGPGMMAADANRDGVVTRAEFLALAETRFRRMDTNGDGRISAEERAALRTARPGAPGMAPPPPPPGEPGIGGPAGDRRAAMLRRFDTDGDGQLSPAERQAARQAMMAGRGATGADTPPPPPAGMAPPPPAPGGMGARALARIDTDGDGAISLAEHLAFAGARFDRMDANRDGRLDAGETAAMRRPMTPPGTPPSPPAPPPPAPRGG